MAIYMRNKIAENLKLIFSWEFLAIFLFNLIYYFILIQDKSICEVNIYDNIAESQWFFMPILIFFLYKFSKNQRFKETIKNFFENTLYPTILASCTLIASTIILFVQAFYRHNKYHINYDMLRHWDITIYFIHIFLFCLSLMFYVVIYQLVTKQWEKAVISAASLVGVFIVYVILSFLSLFI